MEFGHYKLKILILRIELKKFKELLSSDTDVPLGKIMRVMLIDPVGSHGGMDFLNHQLCESLQKNGCDITLVTSSAYTETRHHKVKCFFEGVFGSDSSWKRALRFVSAACQSLILGKREGFQILHFQVFHVGMLQYLYVLLSRLFRFKVVITAHDVGSFRSGESPWLLRAIYKHSDAVIAHSQVAAKALERIGVSNERISKIPLGNYKALLSAFPDSAEARTELGFESDDLVLLFFGQCKEVKRLDLLIDAVSSAREKGAKRIKLLIAGPVTDADGPALKKQMNCCLSGSFVHHARFIANDELPIYFSAADIAVLPYDRIMQSGVVLFAMSYGVPVLTSNLDGMLEVVEHGYTGLTFEQGSVSDLTDRILEIENGDWPLSKIVEQANNQIDKHYAWAQCAIQTSAVYRQIAYD